MPYASPTNPPPHTKAPARLHTLVSSQAVPPPVHTSEQLLPLERLAWENFERLCLQRALERGAVEDSTDHAGGDAATGSMSTHDAQVQGSLYGTRGQEQQGIDLHVRLPDNQDGDSHGERVYLSLQSRRIQSLTAGRLEEAVSDFLAGSWAAVSRIFVYATSLSAVPRKVADEVRRQRARLKGAGINLEVWDSEYFSRWLKKRPQIVHDFFGRAWVEELFGAEQSAAFRTRLDAEQVAELRQQLGAFYTAFFARTDSGAGTLHHAQGRLDLRERYVLPDVLPARPSGRRSGPGGAVDSSSAQPSTSSTAWYRKAQEGAYGYRSAERATLLAPHAGLEDDRSQSAAVDASRPGLTGEATGIRTAPDVWLAGASRHLLVGNPGSGKSTLLRFALLDLFADSPVLPRWAEQFGNRLPLWFPFHFFTRRLDRHDGAEASLTATLHAWLDQYDVGYLWPLVQKALDDDRLLLIIDGLDEWVNENTARQALTALETFLDQRALPAVASTRPYGLARLQPLRTWQYATMAALSASQQRELVGRWFAASDDVGAEASSRSATSEAKAEAFVKELAGVRDLRQLARVPLFLVLLTGMRLAGAPLPKRRFEVYAGAIDHLLHEHPAQRGAAAGVTNNSSVLHEGDIRQVLAHVALTHQTRGEVQAVPEREALQDVVAALRDPRHLALGPAEAGRLARGLVDIVEGQLGVLVRHGPRDIGFLHRVLLEQLAAEHAAQQLSFDELRRLFAQHARDARWHEVLLAILWQLRAEEVTLLLGDLARHTAGPEPAALAVRELWAQAVFGGFGLPAPQARQHAATITDVIDSHPLVPHRQRLLTACLTGLDDPAVRPVVVHSLSRWVLAAQPLTPAVFHQLGKVVDDQQLSEAVWPLMVAALGTENVHTALTAAFPLATRYGGSPEHPLVVESLLTALHRAATADHMAVIMLALLLGWPEDERVVAAAAAARRQRVVGLRLVVLAAVLGVLPGQDGTRNSTTGARAEAVTRDERAWLISQLDGEDLTDDLWKPLLAEAIVAAAHTHAGEAEQVRDVCLQIISAQPRRDGDRGLAWSVLMQGFAQDAAVRDRVCAMLINDQNQIRFLGIEPLSRAYRTDTDVAAAVEELLDRDPATFHDTELHALAAVSQGPRLRSALLAEVHTSGVPHWAADALATHWADDKEVQDALRTLLHGEPGRASLVSNAAVRVLGAEAAQERLSALLASASDADGRFRREIVIQALLESCQARSLTAGPVAEQIAQVSLTAVEAPYDEHEATAEASVIAVLPTTAAARARTQRLLQKPCSPLAALLAGYGNDPDALQPVLDRLRGAHPALPTSARLHLCTLLRDLPADSALVRQLTVHWPEEPHHVVRSAASAAFHTHLLRDHTRSALPEQEWQTAQLVIRQQAVAGGYEKWAHRRAAWLGAMLTDQLHLLDDLVEYRGGPARLPLGEILTADLDLLTLSEIADHWPALRAHFGDTLPTRLTGDVLSQDPNTAWEYLALVADRHPQLAQELATAVATDPGLLAHDSVLAWYAHNHHGDPQLLNVLLNNLDSHHHGRHDVAALLLAEPTLLGLDADTVRTALRGKLPRLGGYPPSSSNAFRALIAGFPDDPAVVDTWSATQNQRSREGQIEVDVAIYYPLACAAVSADELVQQVAHDSEWITTHLTDAVDPPFAQAVIRRLERDLEARNHVEVALIHPDSPDTWAAQLGALAASATPLHSDVLDNLQTRLHRQQTVGLPDVVHDFTTATDLPVPVILLRILGSPALGAGS
ncbi:NACHT domain-containing protein [Streptomyces sp. NBC_00564]|uniref:NACHT domain-containing protein n=1 Tax=Streptomyces sp. NBC_00564 TaxID=2903663 RepID=UPI00352F8434|nr:NACHT domain-containing protein [Streptomyces sp. NBC_00564]